MINSPRSISTRALQLRLAVLLVWLGTATPAAHALIGYSVTAVLPPPDYIPGVGEFPPGNGTLTNDTPFTSATLPGYTRYFAFLGNAAGQIAGSMNYGTPITDHAFLYSGHVLYDCGTLGGFSDPWAMNASGQIVGESTLPFLPDGREGDYHAFIYSNGQMVDLNSVVNLNGTGIAVLSLAYDISDAGVIWVDGYTTAGVEVVAVLTPTNLNLLPLITSKLSPSIPLGGMCNYQITATNSPFRFTATGLPPGLSLNPTTGLITGIPTTIGTYQVVLGASNAIGPGIARMVMTVNNGPYFTVQPQSQTVKVGSAVSLMASAVGSALTYQWSFNGVNVPGATSATLSLPSVTTANSGAYTVTVTNPLGSTTSSVAFLLVQSTGTPALSLQPQSQTIAPGTTVVFSVASSGTLAVNATLGEAIRPQPQVSASTNYQWYLNGASLGYSGPISTLVLSNASFSNAGSYSCLVSNSSGSVLSNAATLALSTTTDLGRLINISCRAQVGAGANVLIAGVVVGGQGTSGSEPLLIRASGPALTPFGVTGVLPDPQLQLNTTAGTIATNNGWAGSSTVATNAAAVGAFPWVSVSSHDAALVQSAAIGAYTAKVAGASGDSGVALMEVYDATPAGTYTPTSPRLINISTRVQVGTGANVLICGFVVGGSTSKTVLIRASGPALAPLGVAGVLPDPQLQLNSSSGIIASNTGWGGNQQIATTAASVGAFSWGTAATPDSALLVTLPPGAYTAQVSGASGDTGVALIEVYEVP